MNGRLPAGAGHPLLKMQVHRVSLSTPASSKTIGRIGASRRQVSQLLVGLSGHSECVRGSPPSSPRRWSAGRAGKCPDLMAVIVRDSRRGSVPINSSEQDNASRNRPDWKPTHSRDFSSRNWQVLICFFRFSWRSRTDSSSSSLIRFALHRDPQSRSSRTSSSTSLWHIPALSIRSMSPSITLERLPSSFLIVSVFLTRTSSTRSSMRCGSTK